MKKPSSLAQQVQHAQRIFESWPDSHKSSLRLEGSDVFLNRSSSNKTISNVAKVKDKKKLVPA